MTTRPSTLPPEAPECELAFERMPWMINGSLAPSAAVELEAHVAHCPRCRARLDAERDLFRAIRRPFDNVEHAPLAAWSQFEAAVASGVAGLQRSPTAANDASGGEAAPVAPSSAPAALPAAASPPGAARGGMLQRRRLRLALMLQAAAIAVLSCAVLWLLVARSGGAPPAAYHTVSTTDAAAVLDGPAWRVAFDPATPAPAADALLSARGLRVVDGPTADHVYTVAPRAAGSAQVEALRADPRVRLLEPLGAPQAAR